MFIIENHLNHTDYDFENNPGTIEHILPEKKKVFQSSQYELSKQVKAYDWTPNTIDIRQEELARYATFIWRISQCDT